MTCLSFLTALVLCASGRAGVVVEASPSATGFAGVFFSVPTPLAEPAAHANLAGGTGLTRERAADRDPDVHPPLLWGNLSAGNQLGSLDQSSPGTSTGSSSSSTGGSGSSHAILGASGLIPPPNDFSLLRGEASLRIPAAPILEFLRPPRG